MTGSQPSAGGQDPVLLSLLAAGCHHLGGCFFGWPVAGFGGVAFESSSFFSATLLPQLQAMSDPVACPIDTALVQA
jgi:hypothetical protein